MRRELGSLGLALACAYLGACSGEAVGSPAGSGGTAITTSGGAANASGGATSASGGASANAGVGGTVAPRAAVGLTLNLTQTASCPILTGVPDDIGHPAPNSATTGMGIRVYDGDEGVALICSVKASAGGSFLVTGSISSSAPRVAATISGSTDATGVGTAIVSLSSRALPADVLSPADMPCTLTVVPNDGLAIKPGAIWARFSCAKLLSPPNYNCAATGEFVLENCAK